MSTQEDDNQPVALAVVAAAVLLAVGLAVGFGIAKSKKAAPSAPAPPRVLYFFHHDA